MRAIQLHRFASCIEPDARRVLARPFIPGDWANITAGSRVEAVVQRILAIPDEKIAGLLEQVRRRFASRHADFDAVLDHHAALVAEHLPTDGISADRRRLVGAYFTQEYAVEAAAITNPSIVPAPEQRGVAPGELRFVLSARAIGEGHISSVAFRSGTLDVAGGVRMDPAGRHVVGGMRQEPSYDRRIFERRLVEYGADEEAVAFALGRIPHRFTMEELETWLHRIDGDQFSGAPIHEALRLAHWLAASNYVTTFPETSAIGERVLFPAGPTESRGMEDARFVHFAEDDGTHVYYATYTAFDGFMTLPQLIETPDFRTFSIATLNGVQSQTKGMALFPRRVGGSYAALTRPDRESIAITMADHVREWGAAPQVILRPGSTPWDLVQLGNCGSPIETSAGWLVLTHGVGPMRRYVLGAMLLDRDDPTRILGALPDALLEPAEDQRDGYVPNVVYSCGGLIHQDWFVVPYGYADVGTGIAVFALEDLLERLTGATAGAA